MVKSLRLTENVVAIFNTMLERPRKAWYGLELAESAEIGSATIYAAMTRMERAGMLRAYWEDVDPSDVGRPRRRLYELTGAGERAGRKALREYRPRVRRSQEAAWLPSPSSRKQTT